MRVSTSDGVVGTASAPLTIPVFAPIWQCWWFLALAVQAVTAAVLAAYRYHMNRRLEITNIRTRIAADLHDDIGSNLTRIAFLTEVAIQQLGDGNPHAGASLLAIASIARESVGSMSDIVWAIDPQRDSLHDLVRRMREHSDELFTQRNIELEFNAPTGGDGLRVDPAVRRGLLLIFKEATNNAARHSKCRRVKVDFSAEAARLVLRIADDGNGFDTSAESDGQGLHSMNRRATALGGELQIHSCPGQDTIVNLNVPLTARRRPRRSARTSTRPRDETPSASKGDFSGQGGVKNGRQLIFPIREWAAEMPADRREDGPLV